MSQIDVTEQEIQAAKDATTMEFFGVIGSLSASVQIIEIYASNMKQGERISDPTMDKAKQALKLLRRCVKDLR